jgi:hypothetical protein
MAILKGFEMKRAWTMKRCYPSIRLEGLRKTTEDLSHGSRSLGRDFNAGSHEYISVNRMARRLET